MVLTALLGLAAVPAIARADWVNVTGAETAPNVAEIYVLDDRVEIVLEIYVGDLGHFEPIVPEASLEKIDENTAKDLTAEQLRRFSTETFQVVADGGEKLLAEVRMLDARLRKDRQSAYAGMINPATRRPVPTLPSDPRVAHAELVYRFPVAASGAPRQPAALTFVPPLAGAGGGDGEARVTIGFIAYHKAVPVIDFQYLSGPARLNLDWADPWYSKFESPNLKRHHESALMSYLYVEPFEVRHEVLTRVKDLEAWIDLGLRGDRYIEIDELEPLKKRIAEFLLRKNPVRIDGELAEPILDRVDFVEVGLTGIQLIPEPRRLEISTAMVGVIIAYLTDGLPEEVTIEWELFTDEIRKVPATSVDPAGSLPVFLYPPTAESPRENVHRWVNHLERYRLPTVERVALDEERARLDVPLGSILCLFALLAVAWGLRSRRTTTGSKRLLLASGVVLVVATVALYPVARISVARPGALAPALTDAEAKTILESLLRNVYRAFDFRQENVVYDKLALSVDGDLLRDIYVQSRKSLEIEKAGGAQAKVKRVHVREAALEPGSRESLACTVKAQWTALGTVGHWGHVHTRKNLYDALVTIEAIEGHWKITALELLEERRVDPYGSAAFRGAATPAPASEG